MVPPKSLAQHKGRHSIEGCEKNYDPKGKYIQIHTRRKGSGKKT